MAIIDCRYRPSTTDTMHSVCTNPVYAEYIEITDFRTKPVKTLAQCIAELRGHGIEKAVVTGRDLESTFATPQTNTQVFACMQAAPELFIGFYGYDPYKGMQAWHAFKAAVEQGMRGASIEPCMAKCCVADAKYYPLYALCCDYDIPVSITAGLSPHMPGVTLEHVAPLYIDKVATDFPSLRILISHGAYPWVNEAIGITMRHNHVFMDFSSCENKLFGENYIRAANEYIADKVVFSSANPFIEVEKALHLYEKLEFTPEVRKKIMRENAVRLLSL